MINFILVHKAHYELIAALLLIVAAWGRGAGPEKAVAAAFVFFIVVDPVYHWLTGVEATQTSVEYGNFVQDCVAGVWLIAVALRANRVYTLWLAAFQLVAIVSHVARALGPSTKPVAYAVLAYGPSYLMLLAFSIGLAMHVRRFQRLGPYRSWRNDSPPWRRLRAAPCVRPPIAEGPRVL